MNPKPIDSVEKRRIVTGTPLASDSTYGNNGAFALAHPGGATLLVIASDGEGWEHVSVSVYGKARCPTWEEMCWVKDQFWGEEELVVQYHPPRSDYVNNHPFTLHLWKPIGVEIPAPPAWMVGVKKRKRH